jgi:hypothetical protein
MSGMRDLPALALLLRERLVVRHGFHDLSHFRAKHGLEFRRTRVRVFERIVQQCRCKYVRFLDSCACQDPGNLDGVIDVRRRADILAPLSAVLARGEGRCFQNRSDHAVSRPAATSTLLADRIANPSSITAFVPVS